ncbi:MAG: ABC transporter ATP-binding protein [Oscillospiraceae bacterium]|nr:ABC transporter ATP-binding protein [Oscillospiraceae bacterium]
MTDEFYFSCKGLTVGYNKKPLISDISVGIKRGEILALIGPNGAGKSTILKSISKQLSLISGSVFIGGDELSDLSPKGLAARLAVVLTDRVCPELMTVGELVASGRYPYTNAFGKLTEDDRRIVRESLEQVHALELYDREISTLSDGQRQRVMLARALCQQPEIIVLDEPVSFLDIKHKTELLETLHEMSKSKGITIVLSLHEIDLAAKISDKIMCVRGEHILKIGTPEEIFVGNTVSELYEIELGKYNPLFGSSELFLPTSGDPKVFVIGGNGSGIIFYRLLRRLGISFYAGILFENDIDFQIASVLAKKTVSCSAFSKPDEQTIRLAEDCMEGCEYVIDCGCEIGEINKANETLLKNAEEKGKTILRELSEVERLSGK